MIRITTEQANYLLNLFKCDELQKYKGKLPELDEVAVAIADQIDNPSPPDLLDRIAAIISAPRIKSSMNGETLRILRRALLSPRELAVIETQKTTRCAKCLLVIQTGEMCTLYMEDVFCRKCMLPSLKVCRECESVSAVPSRAMKAFVKAMDDCEVCAEKANSGGEAPSPAPVAPEMPEPEIVQRTMSVPTEAPIFTEYRNNPFEDVALAADELSRMLDSSRAVPRAAARPGATRPVRWSFVDNENTGINTTTSQAWTAIGQETSGFGPSSEDTNGDNGL